MPHVVPYGVLKDEPVEKLLSPGPTPVMIIDDGIYDDVSEGAPFLVCTGHLKPILERMVLSVIVLAQKIDGQKGLNMPRIETTIHGEELSRVQCEKLLPQGAKLVGHDVGNGSTHLSIESKVVSLGAGMVQVDINFRKSGRFKYLNSKKKTEAELVKMLKGMDVEANRDGTPVSRKMAKRELASLIMRREAELEAEKVADALEAVAIVDDEDNDNAPES